MIDTPSMRSQKLRLAIVTPARNEETNLQRLGEAVISQSRRPHRWIIVNDRSTDGTQGVAERFSAAHTWIETVNLSGSRDRNFGAKVRAFNHGLERLVDDEYDIIGNLDSDLSFDDEYFAFLMEKFETDCSLGVSGTIFREDGYCSGEDSFEGQYHVAGGCQLFRKECFQQIGGYVANPSGGIDWIAVTTARMMGWKTRSYREKYFFHHRALGTAERGPIASAFSYGEKDYYLGGHPLWQLCRATHSLKKKPYLVGGVALLLGYCWAWITRTKRPVSNELMRFHRCEQMSKLRRIVAAAIRMKQIDSFELTAGSESKR